MPHVELRWKDSALYLGRKVLAGIEPDQKYPQMWRVRLPDGRLSGMLMLNRTRAKDAAQKDAAQYVVLAILNAEERGVGFAQVAQNVPSLVRQSARSKSLFAVLVAVEAGDQMAVI